MRNVVLSLIAVVALTVGGLGGTFATWSDSETSGNNTIMTGSLDLKVQGQDDQPWGQGVPAVIDVECVIPDVLYGPFPVELWNAGECTRAAHAFIHLKEYICSNVDPKWVPGTNNTVSTGYMAPDGSGLKPEPELVAEYDGKVDCTWVEGIGPEGDECSMGSHVFLIVTGNSTPPVAGANADVIREDLLIKWQCQEVFLFDLEPCQPRTVYLWFYLQQDSEELWNRDFINPDPWDADFDFSTPEDMNYWKKFNDWPSWALMKDKVNMTIEFDLWLEDLQPA